MHSKIFYDYYFLIYLKCLQLTFLSKSFKSQSTLSSMKPSRSLACTLIFVHDLEIIPN